MKAIEIHRTRSRNLETVKSYLCAAMEIEILKSKIHRAVITEANLNYVGSLTLDEDLMDAGNFIENEKIQVVNVNNGERLETYLKRETGKWYGVFKWTCSQNR